MRRSSITESLMRTLAALLALTVTLLPVLDAAAQDRSKQRRSYDGDRYEQRHRTSTMDRQGLCVRDNGRPMDSLDLNNRCDREEFWARFNDLGNSRR
jgi:hypothetical protein